MARQKPLVAVSLDVHGLTLEKKSTAAVLIPQEGREHWAWCAEEAVLETLGVSVQVDPDQMARAKMRIELRTPRRRSGRPLRESRYFEWINELLIREVLPEKLVEHMPLSVARSIAKHMRVFHRSDRNEFTMYPDVRELVEWLRDKKIAITINSGQPRAHVEGMLEAHRFPMQSIREITTTETAGMSKMREGFWLRVARDAQCDPQEVVILGNNPIQDTMCTRVGSPALLLDRDGFNQKVFFEAKEDTENRLRGTLILRKTDPVPPIASFIEFCSTPEGMRTRLEEMLYGAKV